MSLLSLLSYLVLGYLVFGVIRNKVFGNQEGQSQENKSSCMDDTVNAACEMGRTAEEMFQRACSMNDFVFTAKVFKILLSIY
jgi:hypothetical protein